MSGVCTLKVKIFANFRVLSKVVRNHSGGFLGAYKCLRVLLEGPGRVVEFLLVVIECGKNNKFRISDHDRRSTEAHVRVQKRVFRDTERLYESSRAVNNG